MYRVKLSSFIIITACLANSLGAQAGVRSYFSPRVLGDKIAFCTADNTTCGKVVADAWCEHNGFTKALIFQRDRTQAIESNVFVRFADTGKVCEAGDKNKECLSFKQIKCISEPQA